jgi:hypothetical protein
METHKFLIANGNPTALVSGCSIAARRGITKQLLNTVEQVGFISFNNRNCPKLTMMGNELCINATIAFASMLGKNGLLLTSGINPRVRFQNESGLTKIEIPYQYKQIDNIILFNGIGFILLQYKQRQNVSRSEIEGLAQTNNLPAFGCVLHACGSGSLAYSIFSARQEIIQPSEGSIFITKENDHFSISAEVKRI